MTDCILRGTLVGTTSNYKTYPHENAHFLQTSSDFGHSYGLSRKGKKGLEKLLCSPM